MAVHLPSRAGHCVPPRPAGRADYYGNLPNLAARVSALAQPGQVLLEGCQGFGEELQWIKEDSLALLQLGHGGAPGPSSVGECIEISYLGQFLLKVGLGAHLVHCCSRGVDMFSRWALPRCVCLCTLSETCSLTSMWRLCYCRCRQAHLSFPLFRFNAGPDPVGGLGVRCLCSWPGGDVASAIMSGSDCAQQIWIAAHARASNAGTHSRLSCVLALLSK